MDYKDKRLTASQGAEWAAGGQGIWHAELVEALDAKDARIFEAMTGPAKSIPQQPFEPTPAGFLRIPL
jgi:hypothetical protein